VFICVKKTKKQLGNKISLN